MFLKVHITIGGFFMYAEKLLEIAHAINSKNESLKEDFEKDLNMCFQYTNTAAMSAIEIEMGNGDINEK